MLWKPRSITRLCAARFFQWEYTCLQWEFHRNIRRKRNEAKNARLLARLYKTLLRAIAGGQEAIAYRTVDLLKLAYGERMLRANESARLMSACAASLEAKQYEVTEYILSAYKPLIRNVNTQETGALIEQLSLVENLAKRLHQAYLMDKIAACVFVALDGAVSLDEQGTVAALSALRNIGLNAIKNDDLSLFRGAAVRLPQLHGVACESGEERLIFLVSVWMDQIVKRDKEAFLPVFCRSCTAIAEVNLFSPSAFLLFADEIDHFCGELAANYRLKCTGPLTAFLLDFFAPHAAAFRRLAEIIVKTVKMSVEMYDLDRGFIMARPLLEKGRLLLNGELQFEMSDQETRRKCLFETVRASAMLAGYIAQRDILQSRADIVMALRARWRQCYQKEINRSSVDQFSQLVLLQILKNASRRNSQMDDETKRFVGQPLLTPRQMEKIGLA